MASQRNGTIYVGVTNDLARRVWEHKNNLCKGFTQEYAAHLLVWCEAYPYVNEAIAREKQIKKWNRAWKLELIEKDNPQWKDLSDDFWSQGSLQSGDGGSLPSGFPLSRE